MESVEFYQAPLATLFLIKVPNATVVILQTEYSKEKTRSRSLLVHLILEEVRVSIFILLEEKKMSSSMKVDTEGGTSTGTGMNTGGSISFGKEMRKEFLFAEGHMNLNHGECCVMFWLSAYAVWCVVWSWGG